MQSSAGVEGQDAEDTGAKKTFDAVRNSWV